MKGFGLQLNDNTDTAALMDLKIDAIVGADGLITSGLVLGNTLQQNKALILIAQTNDFKFAPTLGVGIEDVLLADDLLEYRHKIRHEFNKDGLKVSSLDLYSTDKINIIAAYE